MTEPMVANKGLAGLIADDSAVSKVDVSINKLIYRGFDINELCEKASFLETAYLLVYGVLPNQSQLEEFKDKERSLREIPDGLYKLFETLPEYAHPMDMVKIGINYIAMADKSNVIGDTSHEGNQQKFLNLFAKVPTIIANGYRTMHGQGTIAPDENLEYSANFLSMLRGEKVTDPLKIKVFDDSLILYAEHGFNASTFAARVTASTLSDYYSAICSGIGALKGPLHGGANEQVMYMLKEIGSVEQAEAKIREKFKNKEKIMGFGHRLYRTGDSRTQIIKEGGRKLAEQDGNTLWHDISDVIENLIVKEKNIYPNLDFPAATAYYLLGIPIELYTPIFVASRVTGWSAHILEQHDDNRLIRPGCRYVGPEAKSVPPIEER